MIWLPLKTFGPTIAPPPVIFNGLSAPLAICALVMPLGATPKGAPLVPFPVNVASPLTLASPVAAPIVSALALGVIVTFGPATNPTLPARPFSVRTVKSVSVAAACA